jgi:putative FmdB family regulatory protein
MAIYEYQCEKCEQIHEIWEPIWEPTNGEEKHICECGGELKRILSVSNFQLKGDGWDKPAATPPKEERKTGDVV